MILPGNQILIDPAQLREVNDLAQAIAIQWQDRSRALTCPCLERFLLNLWIDPDQQNSDSIMEQSEKIFQFLGPERLKRGLSYWIGHLMVLTGWQPQACLKAIASASLKPSVIDTPMENQKWQEAIDQTLAHLASPNTAAPSPLTPIQAIPPSGPSLWPRLTLDLINDNALKDLIQQFFDQGIDHAVIAWSQEKPNLKELKRKLTLLNHAIQELEIPSAITLINDLPVDLLALTPEINTLNKFDNFVSPWPLNTEISNPNCSLLHRRILEEPFLNQMNRPLSWRVEIPQDQTFHAATLASALIAHFYNALGNKNFIGNNIILSPSVEFSRNPLPLASLMLAIRTLLPDAKLSLGENPSPAKNPLDNNPGVQNSLNIQAGAFFKFNSVIISLPTDEHSDAFLSLEKGIQDSAVKFSQEVNLKDDSAIAQGARQLILKAVEELKNWKTNNIYPQSNQFIEKDPDYYDPFETRHNLLLSQTHS